MRYKLGNLAMIAIGLRLAVTEDEEQAGVEELSAVARRSSPQPIPNEMPFCDASPLHEGNSGFREYGVQLASTP
jgi:hypothetical protein